LLFIYLDYQFRLLFAFAAAMLMVNKDYQYFCVIDATLTPIADFSSLTQHRFWHIDNDKNNINLSCAIKSTAGFHYLVHGSMSLN